MLDNFSDFIHSFVSYFPFLCRNELYVTHISAPNFGLHGVFKIFQKILQDSSIIGEICHVNWKFYFKILQGPKNPTYEDNRTLCYCTVNYYYLLDYRSKISNSQLLCGDPFQYFLCWLLNPLNMFLAWATLGCSCCGQNKLLILWSKNHKYLEKTFEFRFMNHMSNFQGFDIFCDS